ncbi:MAG TPA: YtxH domain-containing protein [Chitinophagaceae bacterium]|nr:YtxH domain-containing protein [Chitinophagaceae bacterium]
MKTALSFLGGLAAGVCIGLLIAPEKGSVTCKKIAEKARNWSEILTGFFADQTKGKKSTQQSATGT